MYDDSYYILFQVVQSSASMAMANCLARILSYCNKCMSLSIDLYEVDPLFRYQSVKVSNSFNRASTILETGRIIILTQCNLVLELYYISC